MDNGEHPAPQEPDLRGDPMASRRPRHGQNPRARAYAGPVLLTLVLLITGAMALQSYGATPLKLAVAAATMTTIISLAVWRQKRRARRGAAGRPPAEPPGDTSAEQQPMQESWERLR